MGKILVIVISFVSHDGLPQKATLIPEAYTMQACEKEAKIYEVIDPDPMKAVKAECEWHPRRWPVKH